MTKSKEDKITIRQFRDNSSNFWCDNAHYFLNENNEIIWCAGEQDKEELRTALQAYIKRNKKLFIGRQESKVVKSYSEMFTFGKHINKTVDEVFLLEKSYLEWCLEKYSFTSAQEKLKSEITEILKS